VLLGGAAGGVFVFALTTTAGWVVRTRQRGRELRGMSRMLWPEMRDDWIAVGAIKVRGFTPNASEGDYPIREAWLDTRAKLGQLMPEEAFDPLAKYQADIELLDAAMTRKDPIVQWYAGKAQDHERPAMRVVEGYCNARWRPFGYRPGPLSEGGWGRIAAQDDEGEG
jgi:hypothetical protein